MKTIRNILIFVLVLGVFALINLIVHELGHCYTIDAVGGKCEGVYVMPGFKVWPLTSFGQSYPHEWKNLLALTKPSHPTDKASGFVS
jgi:membrane-associated protease RseP (regulator of RpoE activity)